jgi:hypothetical protein
MASRTAQPPRRGRPPLKNFHLPLPLDVYEALRDEASRLQKPATALAREAIETWLHHRRRAAVREAIATYAAEHAGSRVDLDPALERASVELLRQKKPGR